MQLETTLAAESAKGRGHNLEAISTLPPLRFEQVNSTPEWWTRLAGYPDRMIYCTPEWLRFVAEACHAQPVLADIYAGGNRVGAFCGLVFTRLGVPILGSPFPGWTTMYMGFNLQPGVPRPAALVALRRFAFEDLGCLHFEIADRNLALAEAMTAGMEARLYGSYETDLTQSEDALFASMKGACRQCIRKAEKSGVVIEEAAGDDSFATDYYAQLKDVFAKQGLAPTYGLDRVRKLIAIVHPTGNLLLLRARDPEGRCIATGIYPGMNRFAQFWGNASFRSAQHLRPNEALHWNALRYWRGRGAQIFDWGGQGDYKEKYGCRKVIVPRFCQSRFAVVSTMRDQAKSIARLTQRVKGWLSSHKAA